MIRMPVPTAKTSMVPIKPATIVLSPTPVLGVKAIEFLQRLFLRLIGSGLVNDDPDSVDPEAWSLDPEIYEHLLDRLALLRRVVVFSGDVHYGFAASLVGAIVGIALIPLRGRTLQDALPFGCFLAPAAFAALLVGRRAVESYVGVILPIS